MKHKVLCLPHQKIFEVNEETPLLKALLEEDIYIKSSCGGHGSCSDCVVKIIEGKECVNRPSFAEKGLLGNVFFITRERLSCQTKITGNVTIDTSNHDKERDQAKFLQKSANLKKLRKRQREKGKR